MSEGRLGWLRERGEGQAEVRPVELFFDLVYVLAVTQLTHHLLDHLSLSGAGQTLLLLLAVWGAWIYTSWVTNYFDPDTRPVRLMLLGGDAREPGHVSLDPRRLRRSRPRLRRGLSRD
jgi:low temperature requirement protein LtrA